MSEALWRFAVRVWRDKAVESACLRLQDQYQAPVAALLAALWLAANGRAPDEALGRRLRAHADQFEEIYLRPLRAVRRRAAEGQGTRELKRQIQEAELEGERLLLEQLAQLAGSLPGGDATSGLTWLLMVLPDAGVCHEQQALMDTLARAADAAGGESA